MTFREELIITIINNSKQLIPQFASIEDMCEYLDVSPTNKLNAELIELGQKTMAKLIVNQANLILLEKDK